MGLGVGRFEGQRPAVARLGLGELRKCSQGVAQIVVGFRIVGLEFDCAAEARCGFFASAQGMGDGAEEEVELGFVRLGGEQLPAEVLGAAVVARAMVLPGDGDRVSIEWHGADGFRVGSIRSRLHVSQFCGSQFSGPERGFEAEELLARWAEGWK